MQSVTDLLQVRSGLTEKKKIILSWVSLIYTVSGALPQTANKWDTMLNREISFLSLFHLISISNKDLCLQASPNTR